MASCLVCGKPAAARAVNPAFPFCSDRCKRVDLGKWLGEEYRIPTRAPDGDGGGEHLVESGRPGAPGDEDEPGELEEPRGPGSGRHDA